MPEFEREWLELYAGKEYDPKYVVSYAAVRARFNEVLELSWYPNVSTRSREVRVALPRSAFVRCIRQYRHDGNPSIFTSGVDRTFLPIACEFAMLRAGSISMYMSTRQLQI